MAREAIHPGEILADELAELGLSAEAFAREIRVPGNRISQITAGKRGITADTALRLGHWFGTSPDFWLNLQKSYELRLAKAKIGGEIKRLPKRRSRAQRLRAAG